MADTARRAVAELAASQHRAFTRKQAAELGFDRRRVATALRSGWLARAGAQRARVRRRSRYLAPTVDGCRPRRRRPRRRVASLGGPASRPRRIRHAAERRVEATVHRAFRLDHRRRRCDCTTSARWSPATSRLSTEFRAPRSSARCATWVQWFATGRLVRQALTSARRRGRRSGRAPRRGRAGCTGRIRSGTGCCCGCFDSIAWEGDTPGELVRGAARLVPRRPFIAADGDAATDRRPSRTDRCPGRHRLSVRPSRPRSAQPAFPLRTGR